MSGKPRTAWWRGGRPLPRLPGPELLDPDIDPDEAGRPARASPLHIGLVFLGGVVGTLARYAVVTAYAAPAAGLPLPVLSINVTGSFLLGLLGAVLFERRPQWVGARLLLATGVLGGWTTYSSMIAGSLNLDHRGHPGWTLATLAVSLVANVVAAAAGLASGRILVRAAGS